MMVQHVMQRYTPPWIFYFFSFFFMRHHVMVLACQFFFFQNKMGGIPVKIKVRECRTCIIGIQHPIFLFTQQIRNPCVKLNYKCVSIFTRYASQNQACLALQVTSFVGHPKLSPSTLVPFLCWSNPGDGNFFFICMSGLKTS